MRPSPMTKRQREIYDFVAAHIEDKGYAPSLEEIGRRFGLLSLATVHKHLSNLQEKGLIRRARNRSRSIELCAVKGCCPMCGRAFEEVNQEAKAV